VDIQLTTDKPIHTKPYPMNPKMVEVLERMIDDLLARDEIVEVTSPYNMPVLLTHHNSSNKHIPFEKRKWRMCLDVRALNSIILHKNFFSNMVKGVECLLPKINHTMSSHTGQHLMALLVFLELIHIWSRKHYPRNHVELLFSIWTIC